MREALDGVRPYLGSHGGDVELVGVTDGVARRADAGQLRGLPGVVDDAQARDRGRGAQGGAGRRAGRGGGRGPRRRPGRRCCRSRSCSPRSPRAPGRPPARCRSSRAAGCWSRRSPASGSSSCAWRTGRSTPTGPSARAARRRWRAGRWRQRGSSERELACPGCGTALRRRAGRALHRRAGAAPRARARCSSTDAGLVRVAVQAGVVVARWPRGSHVWPRGAPSASRRPAPAARGGGAVRHVRRPRPARHRHLVDINDRRLLCACRRVHAAVRLQGGGRRAPAPACPTRRRRLDDFVLDDAAWDRLRIPVDMAFFFHSTPAERVSAFYPSPAGPTESLLELEAWTELEAANPVLREMEPDVEALLVSRARGMREHWLVPIDDCYELVGLIRSRWRGLRRAARRSGPGSSASSTTYPRGRGHAGDRYRQAGHRRRTPRRTRPASTRATRRATTRSRPGMARRPPDRRCVDGHRPGRARADRPAMPNLPPP